MAFTSRLNLTASSGTTVGPTNILTAGDKKNFKRAFPILSKILNPNLGNSINFKFFNLYLMKNL